MGEKELLDEVPYIPDEHTRKWFSRNEMSSRYIAMPEQYYFPKFVRQQSKTDKQGGGPIQDLEFAIANTFLAEGRRITAEARKLYDWAIEQGIEKGQARIFNTQNQYTKIRYTGGLKNWLDLLTLRLPDNVLWECRRVGEEIRSILTENFPTIMETWETEIYGSVTLSRLERIQLQNLIELTLESDIEEPLRLVLRKLLYNKKV